jgi:hypothetical protein
MDWLLEQLSGGRDTQHADAADARDARDASAGRPDLADVGSTASDDAVDDESLIPPVIPAAPRRAEPAVSDAPADAPPTTAADAPPMTANPKVRWSWETGTVEPIDDSNASGAADAVTPPAAEPVEPTRPAETTAATEPTGPVEPAAFRWGLTPTNDPDPLVAPPPAPTISPTVPFAPTEPPVAAELAFPVQPAVVPRPGESRPTRTQPADAPDEHAAGERTDDYFHPALPIPGPESAPSPDDALTAEVPAADAPAVDAPTADSPVADAPTTAFPIFDAPTAALPTTDRLSADLSTTDLSTADLSTADLSTAGAAATVGSVPKGLTSEQTASAQPTEQHAAARSRSARRGAGEAAAASASLSGTGGGDRSAKRTTRILFVIAGALLIVLVLIGLYVFGTQIPEFTSAAPTPTPTVTKTATPTPTPTPTAAATGPQAPGVHAWDTLRGGECIDPFASPWALKFTVVDCAAPHAAQLVYTNVFSADPAAAFPGEAQLASQINVLCTKPGIINLEAASQFTDAQIQGAYPVTEKQWKSGQRSYFCFVNRAGGEPLTGSIQGSGPAA